MIVLGAGGAVLTALYARAYGRAGYDDWGNYLALLPMFSAFALMLVATPLAWVVLLYFPIAVFGTPLLLLTRWCSMRSRKVGI
ncbi:hypothetical protein [Sinirhodobacter huangdaonensis]